MSSKLKINPKNFSSDNHRIVITTGEALISGEYYVKEDGKFVMQKVFIQSCLIREKYEEKLESLLKDIEEYTGLQLLKSKLRVA